MDKLIVACWIPGVPRTKGSLDRRMQDTPASKAWRAQVARVVRGARVRDASLAWPVVGRFSVGCRFFVPQAPEHQLSGDLDKLLRNVLDAIGCTRADDAHLIADDRMVVAVHLLEKVHEPWVVGLHLKVRHA